MLVEAEWVQLPLQMAQRAQSSNQTSSSGRGQGRNKNNDWSKCKGNQHFYEDESGNWKIPIIYAKSQLITLMKLKKQCSPMH